MTETGRHENNIGFSRVAYSELDEDARVVYDELVKMAGEDGYLPGFMDKLDVAVGEKIDRTVGTVRSAWDRLRDAKAMEKEGERTQTRWKVIPLETEEPVAAPVEAVAVIVTDEELIKAIDDKIDELMRAKEALVIACDARTLAKSILGLTES